MWNWILVFSVGSLFGVALVLGIMHVLVAWQIREEQQGKAPRRGRGTVR